ASPATTTTTTSVTNAQLKALIDKGVADALAARDADRSMNGDDSHNSGMGVRRNKPVVRECTYQDFMKCQPLNFKGHDVTYAMTWADLKKMMTDKYSPRGEIKKLEVELWNLKVKDKIERYTKNKRKQNDNNNQAQQQPPKKQGVAIAYTTGSGERKEYARTLPLCNKCKFHHNGQCTVKCVNCKRVGHLTQDCRSPAATNNQRTTTCYECGNQGHYKSDCPNLKNQNHGNQTGGTRARRMVHALGGREINQDLNNMEDDTNA
ncbi:reverse transcriptase domain-containing protein, partial [Tanacetum coccineum]